MDLVITAAGQGKRTGLDGHLRKEMLPVYDAVDGRVVLRPVIDLILRKYSALSVEKKIVVVNPLDRVTIDYLERFHPEAVMIYQERPEGFGDAVLRAAEYVKSRKFLLNAGDGFLIDMEPVLFGADLANRGIADNVLITMRVSDPTRYGVAIIDSRHGRYSSVRYVVEKPRRRISNLALCAAYILDSDIFRRISASDGVSELTPAINDMVMSGYRTVSVATSRSNWVSINLGEEYANVLRKTLNSAKNALEK